jgi:flagellar protein FliO/FliZ
VSGGTFGLALRLVLSLAVVIGLMWFAARALRGHVGAGGAGVLDVVARQQLGRGSSIAVVRVADQALVIGVTESQVTLLGAADLAAVEAAGEAAKAVRSPVHTDADAGVPVGTSLATGGLQGSIVSPATWKQAVNVLRDRTARKG